MKEAPRLAVGSSPYASMRASRVHLAPTRRAALGRSAGGVSWMMSQPHMKPWCACAVAVENPANAFLFAPSTCAFFHTMFQEGESALHPTRVCWMQHSLLLLCPLRDVGGDSCADCSNMSEKSTHKILRDMHYSAPGSSERKKERKSPPFLSRFDSHWQVCNISQACQTLIAQILYY